MRRFLTILWLLVPIAIIAWHYGPGQNAMSRDRAAQFISDARMAESKSEWKNARELYRLAIMNVPDGDTDLRLALNLSHAKTRMYTGELPEAMEQVDGLLDESLRTTQNRALQDEIRSTSGLMHYYVAWLMRLEGAETEEWTEQTETARQHFRLLAEQAGPANDGSAEPYEKNLEAVIRLARMDLSELKGLPLPSECQGNGDCSGKCRSQKASRTKVAPKAGDFRQQISEQKAGGAGQNERPGGGS